MTDEAWLEVYGYLGYEVSNLGNVRSYRSRGGPRGSRARLKCTPRSLSLRKNPQTGYMQVTLVDCQGKKDHFTIHRLVARAFLAPLLPWQVVNHKDRDRCNNNLRNLEVVGQGANCAHAAFDDWLREAINTEVQLRLAAQGGIENPMPRKPSDAPALRFHKSSGQYYVFRDGKSKYLGKDKEAAETQRRKILAERLLNPTGAVGADIKSGKITVSEVCLACTQHSRSYYDRSHWARIDGALDAVDALYGPQPVDRFGPVELATVQHYLLTRPHQRKPGQRLARNTVNRMVGVVQTLWSWAATRGLVPEEKAVALGLLKAIRIGKGGRETNDVLSVEPAIVEATLPRLGPVVRAMAQLQQRTGMRPGEVCKMLRAELSTCPEEEIISRKGLRLRAFQQDGVWLWIYAPAKHKTAGKGKSRIVVLGPRAQEILRPFLDRSPEEYLFRPTDSTRVRTGKRAPGKRYRTSSYDHAIRVACQREPALPHWSPNQLRHAAATAVNDEFDQAHAQAVLGHTTPNTTALYVDAHLQKAAAVAARLG